LLREVFDTDYGEVARILGRSEAACRQLVHRARVRVRADRARFRVPVETHERLLQRFLAALGDDDQDAMLALVAEDVTWTADGGGEVSATRRVVHGSDRIVRLVRGFERKGGGQVRHEIAWINGEAAIASYVGNRLLFVTAVASDGKRITAFYRVLNPEKLRYAAGA
jgi:RNA polymerase sigma-70 factor (ECF subfamily)